MYLNHLSGELHLWGLIFSFSLSISVFRPKHESKWGRKECPNGKIQLEEYYLNSAGGMGLYKRVIVHTDTDAHCALHMLHAYASCKAMIVTKIEPFLCISGIDEKFMNGKPNFTFISFWIPILSIFSTLRFNTMEPKSKRWKDHRFLRCVSF